MTMHHQIDNTPPLIFPLCQYVPSHTYSHFSHTLTVLFIYKIGVYPRHKTMEFSSFLFPLYPPTTTMLRKQKKGDLNKIKH